MAEHGSSFADKQGEVERVCVHKQRNFHLMYSVLRYCRLSWVQLARLSQLGARVFGVPCMQWHVSYEQSLPCHAMMVNEHLTNDLSQAKLAFTRW